MIGEDRKPAPARGPRFIPTGVGQTLEGCLPTFRVASFATELLYGRETEQAKAEAFAGSDALGQ